MARRLAGRIQAAANVIRNHCRTSPRVAMILGTGLTHVAGEIEDTTVISYSDIPEFPPCDVRGHAGELVMGSLAGKPVAALSGRPHYYEGWSMEDLTLPIRVMRALGAEVLVVSAACGGMNPQHKLGDILIIEDQINLMGGNPLIGPNDDSLGPRFPDMCRAYDPELIGMADAAAMEMGVRAHTGVYVAVAGPSLETRAEYRFLRLIGADVVGMSVAPEVIVAVHCGLRVLGMAIITDVCLPDALEPVNVESVIAVAGRTEPRLTAIVKKVIAGL